MSFAPKSGLESEPDRREDKPSNLYTGVFGGSKPASVSDSTFIPVNHLENLADTIQELCSAKDFSFEVTVGYIAQSLLKLFNGSGVAIAVEQGSSIVCCASAGETAPEVGTSLNAASGISGVCFRTGQSQYCHDARRDERVDFESCQALGILSILISPVVIADRTVGLVEVFSPEEFFFDRTDISSLERIASLVAKAHERRLADHSAIADQKTAVDSTTGAVSKAFAAAAGVATSSPPATEVMAATATVLSAATIASVVLPKVANAVVVPALPSQFTTAVRDTNVAERNPRQVSTGSHKSWLLVASVLLLAIAGWLGMRILFREKPPASSATVASAPSSVAPASVVPASVTPIRTITSASGATQPAQKKTAVTTAASGPVIQSKANAVPAQVVDLLTPGSSSTSLQRKAAAVAEPTPEAPSLSVIGASKPMNLVSSLPTGTSLPTLTRSSLVEPEVLIHKVVPLYPSVARSARVNGEVIVRLTIAKDGSVRNAVIEKGHPMLRGAVLDAVKQWKYKPYTLNGNAQEVETLVSVKFQ